MLEQVRRRNATHGSAGKRLKDEQFAIGPTADKTLLSSELVPPYGWSEHTTTFGTTLVRMTTTVCCAAQRTTKNTRQQPSSVVSDSIYLQSNPASCPALTSAFLYSHFTDPCDVVALLAYLSAAVSFPANLRI